MANETLLTLAADIISAHVSNNAVPTDQVAGLIEAVYGSLAGLGKEPEPAKDEVRAPAVSVRASVKPGGIVCLDCGSKFKALKRHLASVHGLTPEEYRTRWNLPLTYPMVSAEYSERRREMAKTIGLGRKKAAAPAEPAKPAKGAKVTAKKAASKPRKKAAAAAE